MRNLIFLLLVLVCSWSNATESILDAGGDEVCQDVGSLVSQPSAFNSLFVLESVFYGFGYKVVGEKYNAPAAVRGKILNAKVTVTEAPQHGIVERAAPDAVFWQYIPKYGYKGTDRVTFVVEVFGKRFTYTYNLLVHEVPPEEDNTATKHECESVFPNGKKTKSEISHE